MFIKQGSSSHLAVTGDKVYNRGLTTRKSRQYNPQKK